MSDIEAAISFIFIEMCDIYVFKFNFELFNLHSSIVNFQIQGVSF